MTSLTVLCVGTLKEKYLKDGCAEYIKRLSAYAAVDVVELKEEKIADEENPTQVQKALAAEGEKLLSHIPKDAFSVALCVEGKQPDSVSFASLLRHGMEKSGKLVIVIGSSHGLSEQAKRACSERLSMSSLTFPHQLARLMVLESLYRCFTISAGKRYHK